MSEVLAVQGLSKHFGGQKALDSVDLAVDAGEVRALVGQNGCGKSTLIKILAGFHAADGGSVRVNGEVLDLDQPGAGEDAGLRFVHQDLGLVGTLDTVDNLALGKNYPTDRAGMIRWGQAKRDARAKLAALGYDIDIRLPVSKLTMSERTAVAIARALSESESTARLLVLDEPTANLPAAEAQRLFTLVRTIAESGVAVLFVSHHFDEVFGLADSVTILRDGRLVETRQTSSLDESSLIELVIGRGVSHERTGAEARDHGEVVLELQSVSGNQARDISIVVHAGEIVGLAGITGSGREEIAGLVFGATPRSGTVVVDGQTLAPMRPDRSVAAGVALVPSDRLLNAALLDASLRENVTVVDPRPNVINGFLSKRSERSDVDRWLMKLDVRPARSELPFSSLSGGNQQKVVLARWLRQQPSLLLLDEPTQGVDVGAKADIHELIEQAAAGGTAVLVASTDHEELVRLCHRVLVLRKGILSAELQAPAFDSDQITASTISR